MVDLPRRVGPPDLPRRAGKRWQAAEKRRSSLSLILLSSTGKQGFPTDLVGSDQRAVPIPDVSAANMQAPCQRTRTRKYGEFCIPAKRVFVYMPVRTTM